MSSIDKLIDALDGFDNLPVGKMGKTLDRMMEDAQSAKLAIERLVDFAQTFVDADPQGHLAREARAVIALAQGKAPDA